MSLFYSGGMSLNDVFDAEGDRTKKPFRPIPSGRISGRSAFRFTIILFAGALSLLVFVPHREAVLAGITLLTLIIIYDKYHKPNPLSVILMAACRLMVFAVASIAVTGTVGKFAATAGLIQFAYVLVVSIAARREVAGEAPDSASAIPFMIAGISLLDGIVMAVLESPGWLAAGVAGFVLTLAGQKYFRGD
ncbi:MAG: UbiA family prenyltransferase [Nitrospirae bacterium]|nr:UbiA family prenyltransferase [Nitrospirota bacterium]